MIWMLSSIASLISVEEPASAVDVEQRLEVLGLHTCTGEVRLA